MASQLNPAPLPFVCRDCGSQQSRPRLPFALMLLAAIVITIASALLPMAGMISAFVFVVLIGSRIRQPRCRECHARALIPSRTPEGQRLIRGAAR